MVDKYSVKNFKIHQDDIDIKFPGLTILTGTNNSGKSSLIQSIRVLSMMSNAVDGYLPLNKIEGLGGLKDVLNKNVNRSENIVYNLYFLMPQNQRVHVELEFSSALEGREFVAVMQPDAALLTRIRIMIDADEPGIYVFSHLERENYLLEEVMGTEKQQLEEVSFLGLRPLSAFTTITDSGKRDMLKSCFQELAGLSIRYLGPYRSIAAYEPDTGYGLLAANGHNTSEIIARWNEKRIFDGTTFAEAFARWTVKLLHAEFTVKMENNQYKLLTIENGVEFGMNQIGFGNTQILPVIVQILTAQKGEIVIIENPEVHLHPKWKADLIELFFYAASHGVKIVLETQSMEMINRARVMVRKQPELLDKAALYFFEKRGFECEINEIDISRTGQLSVWPGDFLDRVTIEDSFELL